MDVMEVIKSLEDERDRLKATCKNRRELNYAKSDMMRKSYDNIVFLMSKGKTGKEVASILGVSEPAFCNFKRNYM